MSMSGHATLKELVRYTEAADQARLARNAMVRTRNAIARMVPRTKEESKVSNSTEV
jgi:hypothetical protein